MTAADSDARMNGSELPVLINSGSRNQGITASLPVIVNAIAINSGFICDGAKASCAAKIASSVEARLLGMQMYLHGIQFYDTEGIIAKGAANTIRNVGTLAREGMRETDQKIIHMMIQKI